MAPAATTASTTALYEDSFGLCLLLPTSISTPPLTPSSILPLAVHASQQVQGVWFRRYTVDKAQALGLVGWCMNTESGTVKGEAEGPPEKLEIFRCVLRRRKGRVGIEIGKYGCK